MFVLEVAEISNFPFNIFRMFVLDVADVFDFKLSLCSEYRILSVG
jgi:hypothetical protein